MTMAILASAYLLACSAFGLWPPDAPLVVYSANRMLSARNGEEELAAFRLASAKTRIWEISLSDKNQKWLDWQTASNHPERIGFLRIEWLGWFSDYSISKRVFEPTNVFVLAPPQARPNSRD